MDRYEIGSLLLRLGVSGVLFYLGIKQIMSPDDWSYLVPDGAISFLTSHFKELSVSNIVIASGSIDILLAAIVLFGFLLPLVSFLVALKMAFMAYRLGINSPESVKSLGIALAALSLTFRR